jgi:hypothetical protein
MDFPSSPSLNQVFGNYTWDGEKWKQTTTSTPNSPNGRLTLTSGTPVMTSTVSVAAIYWTPYLGAQVPFYNGAAWYAQTVAERSVATTDTTKNPAAIGVDKVNDWFLWDDAGTIRISHGPDWTNDTTRSVGTVLIAVDGILLNNVAITNGPAIRRGTYVGTTRSEGTSLVWSRGGSAAGGSAAKLNVWNMYNRVVVDGTVNDSTATWTYNNTTPRPTNNSTTNRISFVSGLAEDSVQTAIRGGSTSLSTASIVIAIGLALDSTTVFGARANVSSSTAAGIAELGLTAATMFAPQLGFHYVQGLETGDTKVTTFIGGAPQGLTAVFRM